MPHRSLARFLAPLALLACGFALIMVVTGSQGDDEVEAPRPAASAAPDESAEKQKDSSKSSERKRKTYTVRPGDTPSGIAEKTGVELERIEELNPDLDPRLLAPGDRIVLEE